MPKWKKYQKKKKKKIKKKNSKMISVISFIIGISSGFLIGIHIHKKLVEKSDEVKCFICNKKCNIKEKINK